MHIITHNFKQILCFNPKMHMFITFLQLGNFSSNHWANGAWLPRPHPDVPSGAYAVGGPLHPESAAARWEMWNSSGFVGTVTESKTKKCLPFDSKMFFSKSKSGISGEDRRCWFEILFEIGLHVPEWPGGSQCKHWLSQSLHVACFMTCCCQWFSLDGYKLYYCFRWGRCATKTMAKLEFPASASRQPATLATRPSLFFSRHEMRSAWFNDFFPDKQAERALRRL